MALSCSGTELSSPDVLLFYHPNTCTLFFEVYGICVAHIELTLLFSTVVSENDKIQKKCYTKNQGKLMFQVTQEQLSFYHWLERKIKKPLQFGVFC